MVLCLLTLVSCPPIRDDGGGGGDGGSIAFRTLARNLDVGDPALNIDDVFVYRGASLPLKRVSYTQTGAHPDAWSAAPSLSRLGDYVVFTSRATDLGGFQFRVRYRDRTTELFRSRLDMVTVGRSAAANLVLDDPTVAEMHCAISVDDYGQVRIMDLYSGEVIRLNGRAVDNTTLEPGDVIEIGRTRIEFQVRGT